MSANTPLVARASRSKARAAVSAFFAALTGATFLIGSQLAAAPSASAADACSNVEVVFARGTNEAPGVGLTGQAFIDALNARLPGKTVDVYAVDYPASLDFGRAPDGIVHASKKFASIATSCPT